MTQGAAGGFRRYGSAPFRLAVLHGGPGAAGEMAPVARELSRFCGVLEPLQGAGSVAGQVGELSAVLAEHAAFPVTLVGHSWGAWLAVLFAAEHSSLVGKLVLVGSGPFEARYAAGILDTRLQRLPEGRRLQARALIEALDQAGGDAPDLCDRLGRILSTTDQFDALPNLAEDAVDFRPDIFRSVWPEAGALRESGELLRAARALRCPVTAIHGDYDAHPAEGVREPLSRAVADFRFVLLTGCGHAPWRERAAREAFFRVLRREIG